MEENLGLKGCLNIDVTHIDGTTEHRFIPNTVVTLGKFLAARAIVSGAYAAPDQIGWMAIGTGSSDIAAADTTLGTEYMREGPETGATGSVTGSTTTTSTTNDTSRWIGSFGILDSQAINEAGLFNKSGLDLGSMFARTCFADINVVSGDTIKGTWDVAYS